MWEVANNPYQGIDWETVKRLKSNLHTHTTASDGLLPPHAVVDMYKSGGYDVLAITDHDKWGIWEKESTTWPWSTFGDGGRSPETLEMVAVEGGEPSIFEHMISLFNSFSERSYSNNSELTKAIGALGGIVFFAHPPQYNQPPSLYYHFMAAHEACFGVEIYNPYYTDFKWDSVLKRASPKNIDVWGIGVDDFHQHGLFPDRDSFGFAYTTILVNGSIDIWENNLLVKAALKKGALFTSKATFAANTPPTILKVIVDDKSITLDAEDYDSIHWISGDNVVGVGNTFVYADNPNLDWYVRAEVLNGEGVTTTQAIRLRPKKKNGRTIKDIETPAIRPIVRY